MIIFSPRLIRLGRKKLFVKTKPREGVLELFHFVTIATSFACITIVARI
jgi:hypothetical protein